MSEPDQTSSKTESEPLKDTEPFPKLGQLSNEVPNIESSGDSKGLSSASQAPGKMSEPGSSSKEPDNDSDGKLEDRPDVSPPNSLFDNSSDDDAGKAWETEILGEPKGQCQSCNERKASRACFDCGTGGFCSFACYELGKEKGQHECIPTAETTGTKLFRAIVDDKFPQEQPTCNDFYLAHAASAGTHQLHMLLSVYSDMAKRFGITGHQLDQWRDAKQIYNNCVRVLNRHPKKTSVWSFFWLRQNRDAFLEEDTSEVLDFDAYLHANRLTEQEFLAEIARTL